MYWRNSRNLIGSASLIIYSAIRTKRGEKQVQRREMKKATDGGSSENLEQRLLKQNANQNALVKNLLVFSFKFDKSRMLTQQISKQKYSSYFTCSNTQYLIFFIIITVHMIRNPKIESQQKAPMLQEQTVQSKKFVQDAYHIDYINTSKIYCQSSPKCSDVKVNNYLCYQQGQTLYKITQIIYEDKIIRIEDKFEVTIDPNTLAHSSSTVQEKNTNKKSRTFQKVRIFSKNLNNCTKSQKKDKKNIVKNVVKIFMLCLEKKASVNHNKNYLEELNKLLITQKFNNRLIQKIVSNSDLAKQFLCFLEDDAHDEIKYSRIQDKQSHYQAIEIYKNLIANGGRFEHCSSGSYAEQSQGEQSESSKSKMENQCQKNITKKHEESSIKEATSDDCARRVKVEIIQSNM